MPMCSVRPRRWVPAGEKRLAALEGREPRKQTAFVVDHELYDPVLKKWVRTQKTFATKKEAETWRDENVRDIRAKRLTASKITVAQAAQRWIEATRRAWFPVQIAAGVTEQVMDGNGEVFVRIASH